MCGTRLWEIAAKGRTLDGVVRGALLLGEHLEVHQAEVDERATPVVPHADDSALACSQFSSCVTGMASMLQKEDGMRIICSQTDADRESVERKRGGVARSVGDAEVSSKMILVPFRNRLPNP